MLKELMKKEAAKVRRSASLEQLFYYRAKTACRLVLFKSAGVFPDSFINEVEGSLKQYDQTIAQRERKLAQIAENAMQKNAAELGLAV